MRDMDAADLQAYAEIATEAKGKQKLQEALREAGG